MNEKEIVWVDKDLAKMLEESTNERTVVESVINESIMRFKDDVRASIESLDDDAVVLKAWSVKIKELFARAYEDHAEATYKAWEVCDSKIPSIKAKVDQITKELQPLTSMLDSIDCKIRKIEGFDFDRITRAVTSLELIASNKNIMKLLGSIEK